MDHISRPEEFSDSEIEERRKLLVEVPKCRVMKGVAHDYNMWSHQRGNPGRES
jgi:hypothetical protein